MKVMMANLLLLGLMTGFISADDALPLIEADPFRLHKVNDLQMIKATETTKQNLKDQRPRIDLRSQPVDVKSKKLPPILACEQSQHRIVLLDAHKEWRDESAVLWQWSAKADGGVADEHKAWFSHPSDAKCIATNQQVLTVASGGGMALIDIKTKQSVGYGYAGHNPHSAALLPDGRIVTVSSTGNLVQLFERQPDKIPAFQVIQKLELTDAHGVVWDEKRGCIWAMGGKQMKRFDYNPAKADLSPIKTIDLPETEHTRFGGHDLVRQAEDDTLWLSDMEHLWRFNPNTHVFSPLSPHRMAHVKSISRLTDPELTIVMQATTNWWSDTILSLNGKWKRTLPSAKFYKARWWSGGNTESNSKRSARPAENTNEQGPHSDPAERSEIIPA